MMVEYLNLSNRRGCSTEIWLTCCLLPFVGGVKLSCRKISVGNDFSRALRWKKIFLAVSLPLLVVMFANREDDSALPVLLIFLWLFPMLLFAFALGVVRKNHEVYLQSVDTLLKYLIGSKRIRKADLVRLIPKDARLMKIRDADFVGYMLKDLQDWGVISFREINGAVITTFRSQPLSGMQGELRWTCRACGAVSGENMNESGEYVCEYCGTRRNPEEE